MEFRDPMGFPGPDLGPRGSVRLGAARAMWRSHMAARDWLAGARRRRGRRGLAGRWFPVTARPVARCQVVEEGWGSPKNEEKKMGCGWEMIGGMEFEEEVGIAAG